MISVAWISCLLLTLKILINFFVCQLESEEANLNSYLIHSNYDSNFKSISSLAIDHLTGG